MKHNRTISTTMPIEREEGEIIVTITGTYSPARVGRKAHPMDRFAEPDEPATMEDITAIWPVGAIELTEDETTDAEELLFQALRDDIDAAAEARAESREDQ